MFLMFDETNSISKSTGGLVGYDDWFTPSRSGVRFPPCVRFWHFLLTAVILFTVY